MDFIHHFTQWSYNWIDISAMIRGAREVSLCHRFTKVGVGTPSLHRFDSTRISSPSGLNSSHSSFSGERGGMKIRCGRFHFEAAR